MSRDRGSATVWAVVVAGVLCAVFGGVLALGQVVVARHRAGAAADLAALAAAASWKGGEPAACAAARRVARAQGAELTACSAPGEVVEVAAGVALGPYAPVVRARAGPPEALPNAVRSAVRPLVGGTDRDGPGGWVR
ncbi:Rv3654c family TadE-like protein [Streptomyces sp. NPDC093225]|uniref:Rv3654c family TadE-like protein n=1 Tax=Streptomyces sp. NPDC093225 TaxID=3366034 RepID=UPI0037F8A38D